MVQATQWFIVVVCGIFAYSGPRSATPILMRALYSLEYRGYDSAGIAVQRAGGRIQVAKRAGRVDELASHIQHAPPAGTSGIGHTRWATHGRVTDHNSHPHLSADGRVAIVHNGIVENHRELKNELIRSGYIFRSETDSEVISHLISQHLRTAISLEEAVRLVAKRLQGSTAFVAISSTEPGKLVGVRLGYAGGIVVGFCENEYFMSSDVLALLPYTDRVAYVDSEELCVTSNGSTEILGIHGGRSRLMSTHISRQYESAQKGMYEHFMAKEIADQSHSATQAMTGRVEFEKGSVRLPEFVMSKTEARALRRVILVGMGTSLHAAMVGAQYIERFAGLPAAAENASEFRYRSPALSSRDLVVAITQSGETADTLAAMEQAKRNGARLVAIVETEGTQATRLAEHTIPIRAGQEIAVASTKTMMNSLVVLTELALHLASLRESISGPDCEAAVGALSRLPGLIEQLQDLNVECGRLAKFIGGHDHLLYLGRGSLYPIALEGALKMKEVAYLHAEGYAAGEMKHGVNALISDAMPTIVIAPTGRLYEKMVSNVNEVKARGGHVTALISKGDNNLSSICDEVLEMPTAPELITPMLALVPLQLLSYRVSVARGHDPDKPRNLAKTVTVE